MEDSVPFVENHQRVRIYGVKYSQKVLEHGFKHSQLKFMKEIHDKRWKDAESKMSKPFNERILVYL